MTRARLLPDVLHSLPPLRGEFGARWIGFAWQPPADVALSAERACIRFELAGIAREQLRIRVDGKTLHLTGQRPSPAHAGGAGFGYERAEILYGAFERRIELPWFVDPDPMTIDYENGLLLIELRRQSAAPDARSTGDVRRGAP